MPGEAHSIDKSRALSEEDAWNMEVSAAREGPGELSMGSRRAFRNLETVTLVATLLLDLLMLHFVVQLLLHL